MGVDRRRAAPADGSGVYHARPKRPAQAWQSITGNRPKANDWMDL
jgi:hypothetical protein